MSLHQEECLTWFRTFLGEQKQPAAPPANPASAMSRSAVVEPTSPFYPCAMSLVRDNMTLATISLGAPSLSKHARQQTPPLGPTSPVLVGSLLPQFSAITPCSTARAPAGTLRDILPGVVWSQLLPFASPSTFFSPFRPAMKEKALFVPNSRVHLPKTSHQQWGQLPLSCL